MQQRRYRLKKDYERPTHVIRAGAEGSMNHWHNVFPDMLGIDPATLPDWFEELILEQSKDWEIVEFRIPFLGSDNIAFTLGRHGLYEMGLNGEIFKRSLRELIDAGGKINCIKRLSDNEVFTVGDEVYLGILKRGGKIKRIYISENLTPSIILVLESDEELNLSSVEKQESKDVFTWDEIEKCLSEFDGLISDRDYEYIKHDLPRILKQSKQSTESNIKIKGTEFIVESKPDSKEVHWECPNCKKEFIYEKR